MIVIGIDPGLSGAIACIDHTGLLAVLDMPIMNKGKGTVKNQVNAAGLTEILQAWMSGHDKNEVLVLIERVSAMPKQGVATMFSLGHTCGIIEGVVVARFLPHQIITPGQWKKHFGLTSDKDQCRTLAQRLYPQASLSRKKDHNRAEAILIAHYGYEINA